MAANGTLKLGPMQLCTTKKQGTSLETGINHSDYELHDAR